MKKFITTYNINSGLQYLFILLIIINSGAVIGWSSPLFRYLEYLCFTLFIFLMIKNGIHLNRNNLLIFIIILSCGLMDIFFRNVDLQSLFIYLIDYFVLLIFSFNISSNDFWQKYINIIFFISIINLVFYFLSQFKIFMFLKMYQINNDFFFANIFHVYSRSIEPLINTNIRNFGIFWEPGAFQAFLNIAIIYILLNRKKMNFVKIKLLFLIISLITTFSSTGYLILCCTCILVVFKDFDFKKVNGKFFLYVLFLLICLILLLNSSTIIDKFSNSNQSYIIRNNDFVNGWKIILKHPMWGYGFNSDNLKFMLTSFGITANSVGIFIIMQFWGILYGLFIFLLTWRNFEVSVNAANLFQKCIIFCILLMIFCTESFLTKQIFMLFSYSFCQRLNRNTDIVS